MLAGFASSETGVEIAPMVGTIGARIAPVRGAAGGALLTESRRGTEKENGRERCKAPKRIRRTRFHGLLRKTGPSIPFCGEIFNMLAVGAEQAAGEASVIASAGMRRHRIA